MDRYLQKAIRERMGIFGELSTHTVHEGESMRVYRADGTVADTAMTQASVEMTMQMSDIPTMTVQDRIAKLNNSAGEMAKQVSSNLLETLNKSVEESGQVINGKGKPLDSEAIFAALEKMHIDFDGDGKPKGLQLVVGSALMPRILELIEQEKNDLEAKQRHDDLMTRKWIEWRDREASRKLVG